MVGPLATLDFPRFSLFLGFDPRFVKIGQTLEQPRKWRTGNTSITIEATILFNVFIYLYLGATTKPRFLILTIEQQAEMRSVCGWCKRVKLEPAWIGLIDIDAYTASSLAGSCCCSTLCLPHACQRRCGHRRAVDNTICLDGGFLRVLLPRGHG